MLSRVGHRKSSRNITPPKPSYMSDEQLAAYLADLRTNRPRRPNGSRPLPPKNATAARAIADELPPRAPSAMSISRSSQSDSIGEVDLPPRASSAMSHHRTRTSISSPSAGHPLVQQPHHSPERDFSTATNASVKSKWSYRESGQRWMEKQEAQSLREALEKMDVKEDEKLHAAAQDEASELVWKHMHPEAAEQEIYAPYSYQGSTGRGSHGRTKSVGPGIYPSTTSHKSVRQSHRSASDSSTASSTHEKGSSQGTGSSSGTSQFDTEPLGGDRVSDKPKTKSLSRSSIAMPPSALRRKSSNGSSDRRSVRISLDGPRGLFRNPTDHIYEEPEEVNNENSDPNSKRSAFSTPSKSRSRKSVPRVQFAKESLVRSSTEPIKGPSRFFKTEIYKNPPSKSRDPGYTSNPSTPTPPPSAGKTEGDVYDENGNKIFKDGIEVRSDDIRAATSMKLKDRSPKLPMPTAVSDRPGRPIVSFDPYWKAQEEKVLELEESRNQPSDHGSPSRSQSRPVSSKPPLQHDTMSAPTVPTINTPSSDSRIPVVKIPDQGSTVPSINVSGTPSISVSNSSAPSINAPSSKRPLPNPRASKGYNRRPLPQHSATAPTPSTMSRWTPSIRRPTAQCAACALPIAGRILTAANYRFHPECFACYHCGEGLECVAFYPEPDNKRAERLGRIHARAKGQALEEKEGQTADDDGDDGPRFYCHLDFHEFFSPRCKSCGTPIEGEVVVACGAGYHVGHFFCAECGDPFDSKTPFVEKDGYAWCVNCHTRRYSTKCRKCRRPVTDTVVKALGSEWHQDCFVCMECGGGFDDGKFFLRGEQQNPVCVKCEEQRLKA